MAYTQYAASPVAIGARNIVPQLQAITEVVSTTPRYTLGTRMKFLDPDTGYEAEFQYCAGVASTVAGSAVCISGDNAITLAAAATTGLFGVAMAALDSATKYGWVAIDGVVPVNVLTGCAANPAYTTSTAGSLDDAVVAGSEVPGASFISAIGTPAAGQCYIRLNKSGMV